MACGGPMACGSPKSCGDATARAEPPDAATAGVRGQGVRRHAEHHPEAGDGSGAGANTSITLFCAGIGYALGSELVSGRARHWDFWRGASEEWRFRALGLDTGRRRPGHVNRSKGLKIWCCAKSLTGRGMDCFLLAMPARCGSPQTGRGRAVVVGPCVASRPFVARLRGTHGEHGRPRHALAAESQTA